MQQETAYSSFNYFLKYILISKYLDPEELRNMHVYVYKHGSHV